MPGSVARLCPDVLSLIVRYAVENDDPKTYSQYVFSHVCREWRSVALSDSALWTTPPFNKPQMALSMIERSRRLPITVRLTPNNIISWDSIDLVDALMRSAGIKHLSFGADLRILEELLERLERLPVLESLDLTQLYNSGLGSILSSRLLQEEELPRLRKVSLSQCLIRWDAKCLTDLTHLTIDLRCQRPRLPGLFAMLCRCPTLEYLKLRDMFPASGLHPELAPDLIDNPQRYVVLPNLRQLYIDNDLHWIHCFLLALYTPRLSHLELNVRVASELNLDEINEEPALFGSDLERFCHSLNGALNAIGVLITSVDADGEWDDTNGDFYGSEVNISCRCRRAAEAAMAQEVRLVLNLYKAYLYNATFPEEDLTVFLKTIRTDCLESVCLALHGYREHAEVIDSVCVWEALSSMPALKRVVLTGNEVDGIPDDILSPLNPLSVHGSVIHNRYFPSLEYFKYETFFEGLFGPTSAPQLAERIVPVLKNRELERVEGTPSLTVELHLKTEGEPEMVEIEVSSSGARITYPDS